MFGYVLRHRIRDLVAGRLAGCQHPAQFRGAEVDPWPGHRDHRAGVQRVRKALPQRGYSLLGAAGPFDYRQTAKLQDGLRLLPAVELVQDVPSPR